jgi:hypothetical protein
VCLRGLSSFASLLLLGWLFWLLFWIIFFAVVVASTVGLCSSSSSTYLQLGLAALAHLSWGRKPSW